MRWRRVLYVAGGLLILCLLVAQGLRLQRARRQESAGPRVVPQAPVTPLPGKLISEELTPNLYDCALNLTTGAQAAGETRVLLEGGPLEVPGREGFYVKPALLGGSLDNVAAREEIFGPVAYLSPFGSEDEAIRMVNQTDYGLANSVWTNDLTRAHRVAESMVAGSSWINAHNVFPHGVPYAGVNKSGLGGGVLSVETLFDYWRSLSVVRPL